jgi:hypothetical protein
MLGVGLIAAAASGGRFTPVKPTLTYAGSGTSNNGKFTISNYNATFIYTIASGSGSVSGNTLTVTNATSSVTLTARAPKGTVASPGVIAERKAAVLISVPFTQYFNPCGDCTNAPGFWTWTCGCVGADAGGGQWGECICRGPGFSYWENQPGYNWSGNDYTNGQGEWWKIT